MVGDVEDVEKLEIDGVCTGVGNNVTVDALVEFVGRVLEER